METAAHALPSSSGPFLVAWFSTESPLRPRQEYGFPTSQGVTNKKGCRSMRQPGGTS
jgi:hypothetical protein